ncbi:hypothetical protein [Sulfitobacter sp.]|uniref:hypothetical protein n=1 Tax=Sulfitobacter sp. TaxID=1903071 RepID=UPI0030013D57
MLKFFKKFRSSMKFGNRISQEIGVDNKIFQSTLTQMGINLSLLEEGFAQDDLHLVDEVRMQRLCMRVIPVARLGAAQLVIKFGNQPMIEGLIFKMIDYQNSHIEVVDDPAEYKREKMHQ